MKTLALQLRLSLSKNSKDDDLVTIWNPTTQKNAKIDSLIDQQQTKQAAMNLLASEHSLKIDTHISSLKLQGKSFIEIQKALPQKSISNWNSFLESVPDHLFTFTRKAMQQQLPTAANLFRWSKISSSSCGFPQTNKHVLSNFQIMLSKYTRRNDHALEILLDWFKSNLKDKHELYADFDTASVKPITDLFFQFT